MKALLTTDDGFDAVGLAIARQQLIEDGFDVSVYAPDNEIGGTGTGWRAPDGVAAPPSVDHVRDDGTKVVFGPPARSIFTAFTQESSQWDLVVCGINHGPNVGLTGPTSGTVGSALFANSLNAGSGSVIAISLDDVYSTEGREDLFEHWDTAATILRYAAAACLEIGLDGVLVVNVPDIERNAVTDIRLTRPSELEISPAWPPRLSRGEGTDVGALTRGAVSCLDGAMFWTGTSSSQIAEVVGSMQRRATGSGENKTAFPHKSSAGDTTDVR